MDQEKGPPGNEVREKIEKLRGDAAILSKGVPAVFSGSVGSALELVSGVLSVLADLSGRVDSLAVDIERLKSGDR